MVFQVKGFQLEYLVKVPEVKDTVHKHSLLHHLCHMVMEKFPDSTDLYSEVKMQLVPLKAKKTLDFVVTPRRDSARLHLRKSRPRPFARNFS